MTLVASALPVRMPRGIHVRVSIAPIDRGDWRLEARPRRLVALIGTTELRELRGEIPWYGTLANHAGIVLPAISAVSLIGGPPRRLGDPIWRLHRYVAGASPTSLLNLCLVAVRRCRCDRTEPFREFLVGDAKGFAASLLALAPLGWLMAQMY